MTTNLVVAAAQIQAGPDPVDNLALVAEYTARAADAGARLVVFPEATMACFATSSAKAAQPLDGPFATGVRSVAQRHGVTLVVGMFEPSGDGRAYNTLLATGGGVDATYRKIHLYDAFGARESDTIAPGRDVVTIDVDGVTVGLATCYDVRFADHFTTLGRAGAQLVVLPASWGDGPGKAEQWDLLTRARAHDAQAWLLAADQAWQPGKPSHPLGVGRSCLVDPLGVVRARLDAAPGVVLGQVDTDTVDRTRERVPVLRPNG